MKRSYWILIAVVIIAAGIYGWYYTKASSMIAPEMTTYAKDWPSSNKDYGNTRSSSDSSITSANIANLKPAWSLPISGSSEWGAAASNPLIVGNNVYLQDLKSNVYALDLATGSLLWKKEYNTDGYGPNGPAIGWNKIFVTKGHYEVAALDMRGNELWSQQLGDKTVGIDIQPIAYDNMVYVSTVPGTANANFYTGGGAGVLYALDQKTGAVKWSFNTVDTADIWGNPTVNSGGGAWFPPAIDTKTHNMFWGTGNPAPWPGTKDFPNGSSRPGANLYTNSMLALDHLTGKLLWYNQVLSHDIFDLDLQNPPILASLPINGTQKDIVIGSGKLGKVYAFERSSGQLLWSTAVGQHQNDELKELPAGTTRVLPGPLGGVETPMAYMNGIVYAPIVNIFADYTPVALDGSTFDVGAGTGELTALDASNGTVLWNKTLKSINVGAATVVNDLVFTSTMDGMIYALNRLTGEQVWQYQAPGGINAWPAVAKDTIIFPVGLGSNPALIAFKII